MADSESLTLPQIIEVCKKLNVGGLDFTGQGLSAVLIKSLPGIVDSQAKQIKDLQKAVNALESKPTTFS